MYKGKPMLLTGTNEDRNADLASDLFFRPIMWPYYLKKKNYVIKTVNIPVYGNIVVYIKYCTLCLKIDYTLRCLEYICSVYSPLIHHGLLLR